MQRYNFFRIFANEMRRFILFLVLGCCLTVLGSRPKVGLVLGGGGAKGAAEVGVLKVIEKAIIDSPVGIMPENNGEIIRLGIPALTEERRKDLTKQCSKEAETAKVSVRNARREAIDKLKKSVKNGVPEDVEKDSEDTVQKIHDKYVKKIESMLEVKNKEIMTV